MSCPKDISLYTNETDSFDILICGAVLGWTMSDLRGYNAWRQMNLAKYL